MKKETKKEVAVIEVPAKDIIVMSQYDKLIESGFETNADLERMERLFNLKKEHEENEARKAYFNAFADFGLDPPIITKSVPVKYQNKDNTWTEYDHADLGESLTIIKKHLAPHGLSINFKQKQENGLLTVTCYLTHRLGYQEETSLSSAPDNSGGKNGIQATSSADTYLKRYTSFAITGVHAVGEDDDGKASEPVIYIDEKQVSTLCDMLLAIDKSIEDFCIFKQVESIEKIPASEYINCVAALKPPEAKNDSK